MNKVPPYLHQTRFIFLIAVLVLFPASSSGQIDRVSPVLNRDSLLGLLNWQKGAERVKTLVLLSGQYRLADTSKSLDFSMEALNLAKDLQNRHLVLSGTLGVALAYHHSGNYPRSVSYALEAADMALELGDTMAWVRALTCAGLGYLFSGNPELAMSIARQADVLFNVWTDPARQFDLRFRHGWGYRVSGEPLKAIRYLLGADSVANSSPEIAVPKRVMCLQQLGIAYMATGRFDSALKTFRRGEALRQANRLSLTRNMLADMGACFFRLGMPDSARYYYMEALHQNSECEDAMLTGETWLSIGALHESEKQWQEALNCYSKTIGSGAWMFANKSFRKCNASFELSAFIPELEVPGYTEIAGLSLAARGHFNSYQIYKMLLLPDSALIHLEKFNVITQQLEALKHKNEVIEFSTRYATEEKEQRIRLLSQQQEITSLRLRHTRMILIVLAGTLLLLILFGVLMIRHNKTSSEQQSGLLKQKLLRVQMNPHFIYNSLSSIQGFIMEKDHISASVYLSRFAKLVRNILDNSRVELIPASKEIQTIEYYLELQKVRYEERFDFSLHVGESVVEHDPPIPPMLIQPFVENAIEHGIRHLTTKGTVAVSFSIANEKLEVVVEDNGVGRQKAEECERETRKYHPPLSTALIRERIDSFNKRSSHKITLEITDLLTTAGEPAGTRVVIMVPV